MTRFALPPVALVLALAPACKDEAAPEKPPGRVDAGAPASAGGKAGDLAAAAAPGPDKATMCASRCLLLTRYSLAELEGGRHEKECGVPLMQGTGCDQLDAMRNCIYAAHGYRFEKKRWRDKFSATSWYHPDPTFDETKLSRLETANIRALRDRATKCRSKGRIAVSAADAGVAAPPPPPPPAPTTAATRASIHGITLISSSMCLANCAATRAG